MEDNFVTRRKIKHSDSHFDIEELRTDEDGNSVWAVTFCSEEKMNGYTESTPIKTRVMNLVEQIPQEYRNRAVAECVAENPHDFERALTGYVICRTWETYDHPVNEAEFVDGFCDERLNFKAEQLTGYFGKVKVTTSKEWDKRHLYATREDQAGAAERRKAAGFKGE